MALFFMEQPPRDSQDTFSQECAAKLGEYLISARKTMRRPDMKAWTQEFQILKSTHSESDIRRVLDWYGRNLTREYLPKAYSARSFRESFGAIQSRMEESPDHVQQDQLDNDGRQALLKLAAMSWPRGFDRILPNAILITVRNYIPILTRFDLLMADAQGVCDRNKAKGVSKGRDSSKLRYFELLEQSLFYRPRDFTTTWFEDVYDDIHHWTEWRGPVSNVVFSADTDRFDRLGDRILYAYSGSSDAWREILKQLKG